MTNNSATETVNLEQFRRMVKIRAFGFLGLWLAGLFAVIALGEGELWIVGFFACGIGLIALDAIATQTEFLIRLRDQIESMRAEIADLRAAQGTD